MVSPLSLRRFIVIASCAAGPVISAAQGDGKDSAATLPSVVVTATGFEQDPADAPASISVITREELEKRPFRDLTDALRDVPGVVVTGGTNEQDIYIRGMPGAYTLILVDGKRQTTRDARTNGNSGVEQSFIPPLDAIERIEVIRGPMSSLYGSDAMGGVINVITRKVPKSWGGSLGLDFTAQEHGDSGNANQQRFYLGGPIKSDLMGLQLWGRLYDRDEDRIVNGFSGARDRDLTARLAITPNQNHEILLEAGTADLRRTTSTGYTSATGSPTYSEESRDHASIGHKGRWGWATSEISLSRESGQHELYRYNSGSGAWPRDARAPKIENTVFDGKLTAALGNHVVVGGVQWNQAELTDQNPGTRKAADERFRIDQKAAFIEDEWRLSEGLALTGGLRMDDHEIYGVHWTPRLYSVWHATEQLTVKGGVSRGFRAPDIRTIAPGYAYTTGGGGCTYGPNGTCGVIIGDPSLKPETSTSYELAALWDNHQDLSASATVFNTDLKDKVSNALVYNADGTIARWSEDRNYRLYYSYNTDRATLRGIELSLRWQPTRAVTIKSGYTFTDSKQKGGDYDGYPLSRTPKHMFNLRADWEAMSGLTLWSAYTYHGKETNAGLRIGTNGSLVTNGVREYSGYGLFDLGASYTINRTSTLSVAIYNLGDRRLDDQTYNTVGDGRRVWVSLNTRF